MDVLGGEILGFKMQQLRECQFSKAVVLVCDSTHIINDVCRKANSSVFQPRHFSG